MSSRSLARSPGVLFVNNALTLAALETPQMQRLTVRVGLLLLKGSKLLANPATHSSAGRVQAV